MTRQPLNRRQFLKLSSPLIAASSLGVSLPLMGASSPKRSFSVQEYMQYDALGLAQLVANKEVTPSELLALAIERAEAVNPKINALVLPHYDLARTAVSNGLPNGPLKGVPFLLKDLHVSLEGTITTNGSRFFKDAVADYSSTVVKRYQQAGLTIFGKTASPEFGGTGTTESTLFGETRNPWNMAHSAGGSSGGAAAAVAAGILPAANASDGGGSIRIPASCCGLFGLKPTRARVPAGPGKAESWNSVIHAVSRSVRDSAVLLDIARGPDLGSPYAPPPVERPYMEEVLRAPGRLRIALIKAPIYPFPVDPECVKAVEKAAQLCESLGHHIDEATWPQLPLREYYDAVGVNSSVGTLSLVEAREQVLGRKVTENDLEPVIWHRYQQGKQVSGLAYARSRAVFQQVARQLAELQKDYDVILTPTLPTPPVKLGVLSLDQNLEEYTRAASGVSAYTMLYNMTGQPAMSVPLHWTPEGLPVGVMFAGRFGDEATLFRLAGQLEQAQPWGERRPMI